MTDTMHDLHAITDDALRRVVDTLTDAYRRVTDSDIELGHGEEIAAELGKLSLPLGLAQRSLRRRTPGNLADQVQDVTSEGEQWQDLADNAAARRDELIRHALASGTPVSTIRDWTGLSRERVYQIRDGRR